MQIQGIKEFPDAQDQTHVAAPVSHEAVEVVDDILYGQKGKIVRKKYRFSKLNRDASVLKKIGNVANKYFPAPLRMRICR